MPLLFVYGTLRQGQRYHHTLGKARFMGIAESARGFKIITRAPPDDPEGYPVALEAPENTCKITGELYEIDGESLKAVDGLENYPAEYDRREYEFVTAEGKRVTALMYVGKNDDA
jgi:gamma-glutamylcyclotransferase (GGCT)/AIG2-like uncharacterized protein YtfP